MHEPYAEFAHPMALRSGALDEVPTPPNQMRWNPLPIPAERTDFVEGMVTLGGNGDIFLVACIDSEAVHTPALAGLFQKQLDCALSYGAGNSATLGVRRCAPVAVASP